ncbi:uncharacterized protein LOC119294575 isoform X2 [Triticum dicoccoides]|uniref:uncharacterized protein LOC119294575 isoform X2 n=1 Tax=Triticum dicoccoides TaxID=85692 RepID=UPI00188EAB71|nr:uncharacterized protein LOC119294575 isoform X2 [Triticum dicoccoides]
MAADPLQQRPSLLALETLASHGDPRRPPGRRCSSPSPAATPPWRPVPACLPPPPRAGSSWRRPDPRRYRTPSSSRSKRKACGLLQLRPVPAAATTPMLHVFIPPRNTDAARVGWLLLCRAAEVAHLRAPATVSCSGGWFGGHQERDRISCALELLLFTEVKVQSLWSPAAPTRPCRCYHCSAPCVYPAKERRRRQGGVAAVAPTQQRTLISVRSLLLTQGKCDRAALSKRNGTIIKQLRAWRIVPQQDITAVKNLKANYFPDTSFWRCNAWRIVFKQDTTTIKKLKANYFPDTSFCI